MISQRHGSKKNNKARMAICLLGLLGATGAIAQTTISFQPDSLNLLVGESAFVAVEVNNLPASGLAAAQVGLSYDSALINIINPNEAFRGTVLPFVPLGSDPMCIAVRGTPACEDPDWLIDSTGRTPVAAPDLIDLIGGQVEFAFATIGPAAPPTADGAIGFIEVVGTQAGTVMVTVSENTLTDDTDPPVPFAVSPGVLTVTVGGAADTDLDGVVDSADNCTLRANANQTDTDADGIGNACDGDFDNSCGVNFIDLAQMKANFFTAAPEFDLTGDGVANFLDLGRLKELFFLPPGPSGVPNVCD